jgi:hypothetical protein
MAVDRFLSNLGMLALFLGVCGALGALLYRGRTSRQKKWMWVARGFAALVAVPMALSLPFPTAARIIAWGLGFSAVWLFGARPEWMPLELTRAVFPRWYGCGLLLVIFAWSASSRLTANFLQIGLPALAAAGAISAYTLLGPLVVRRGVR